ncbi:MAG: lysine--tRNA ligase, partial [Gammaproteobacteria bacterium]|nr:lysine--tRNA ligase [Gammaproteobacteria bacterium]
MSEIPVDENKLIAERRVKLQQLRASGEPVFPNDFRRDTFADELHAKYNQLESAVLEIKAVRVRIAGRMMLRRIMGKASFAKLKDSSGSIQIFLTYDALGESYDAFKIFDSGDILGVEGVLFKTKTGELSVRVDMLRLLVKSLRPLPDKWHGLSDTEVRYRQRYVDLIMNDSARSVFVKRTRLVSFLRSMLDSLGFMEVETPMMQPIPGGATARPFVTHHNALDMKMYLRI